MKPVTLIEKIERHGVQDGKDFFGLWTRQGPANYRTLWRANYGTNPETGEQFHQATMPQTIRLVNYGVVNRADERNAPIIEAIHRYRLTGRSLLLGDGIKEIYAVDNPSEEIFGQLNVNNRERLTEIMRQLKAALGAVEAGGVVFSPDGNIRFTSLDKIKQGAQTLEQFAVNPGNILIAGSLENAELNAQTAGFFRSDPNLNLYYNKGKPFVIVPVGGSGDFDSRLGVGGSDFLDYDSRCSFGVSETAEGGAPENTSQDKSGERK